MKCLQTFKNREAASESQRLLKARGIDARVAVDPLESRYPSLSHFQDVALLVDSDRVGEAQRILAQHLGVVKKAS